MYPKNAASPPRIAIGAVIQISDGAVQSSGVSVVVRPEGGSETAGGGTITYGASSSVVYYAPTQAETNYTAFVVTAYKTGCIPVSQTIVTTASDTSGTTNAFYWAGTAITASSLPVATAAGASGGLLISGSNSGTTTLGALTVTGAVTATNASNDIRGIQLNSLSSAGITAIENSVWDAAFTTHTTSGTFGNEVYNTYRATVLRADGAVADVSATTTSFKTNLTEVDNFFNDSLIVFVSGALSGQSRPILTYANANGLITLDEALTSAPADGDLFVISAVHVHPVSQIQAAITGGAYALNDASFAFNAALDFTTAQKAATLARVTLVDTASTVTDGAKSATALSTAQWTNSLATNLGTLAGHDPGATLASQTNITAATGCVLSSAGANAAADALLARNIAGGSSTGRIVSEALYALRNKVAIVAGTMTVYSTDDTTSSWTAVMTGDAAADPIVTMDPA